MSPFSQLGHFPFMVERKEAIVFLAKVKHQIVTIIIRWLQKFALFRHYIYYFSDHLQRHHTRITHPHKHNFYLVVLITKGSGFHEIDFERYEVKPGSVFFMQPGQTHYLEFSPDVEGVIFFHSMAYYQWQFPNSQLSDFPFYFS